MSLSLSPTPARDAGEDTPIMFCARGGEGRGPRNREKKNTLLGLQTRIFGSFSSDSRGTESVCTYLDCSS